jgi:hypothetical protein
MAARARVLVATAASALCAAVASVAALSDEKMRVLAGSLRSSSDPFGTMEGPRPEIAAAEEAAAPPHWTTACMTGHGRIVRSSATRAPRWVPVTHEWSKSAEAQEYSPVEMSRHARICGLNRPRMEEVNREGPVLPAMFFAATEGANFMTYSSGDIDDWEILTKTTLVITAVPDTTISDALALRCLARAPGAHFDDHPNFKIEFYTVQGGDLWCGATQCLAYSNDEVVIADVPPGLPSKKYFATVAGLCRRYIGRVPDLPHADEFDALAREGKWAKVRRGTDGEVEMYDTWRPVDKRDH